VTDEEILTRFAHLESENTNLKNALRQAVDSIKSAVKNDVQDVERRMTDFLGDRLDENSAQTKTNQAEIATIKLEFWGDKDRTVGIVNEVSEITRKMQDFDRLHEEWVGVGGSEDRPGAFAMLNRLWLDLRDRSTRSKTFLAIGSGGGITFLVLAFNFTSGAIEKSAAANAKKSEENEAKVTEVRKLFYALDKEVAIKFAQFQKDIDSLHGGRK
jgi:hypothetical protein